MLRKVAELVAYLHDAGAQFTLADDKLRVIAPAEVLTDDVKAKIASHKEDILTLRDEAVKLLNRRGVRLLNSCGAMCIALWQDAEDEVLRNALDMVGLGGARRLYLDDAQVDVPDEFRTEPPDYVLEVWKAEGLDPTPADWVQAERKARLLNWNFDLLGTSPRPSRIKPETVLHGMMKRQKKNPSH